VSDANADRLIDRWAASHARELIAEAQAEALVLARERLRGRLVEALLHAADERLTAEPRRAPAPDRPAGPSEPVLWVYGVVPDGVEPPATDGVDGHPVRVYAHAGLGALVSDVPEDAFTQEALRTRLEDLERLEALARAHDLVLERAMANGPVVPFRLCTIYSSQPRLDEMLDREGAPLRAALERLDGMQEWGVKAFLRAAVGAPAADASDAAASGTEYLTRKRERRDAAVAGREATDAAVAEIHARLTERAAASALSRPQDRRLSGRETEMVLNAAYLVPAEGAAGFRATVEELGRRHEPEGVELELTGPWPPYHFVEPPTDDSDA
jgi:gas vesicle protein GvpL/GvpF